MGIIIKKRSPFRGLHLPENKITSRSPVVKLRVPEKVILPLKQNIGAPGELMVKRGDLVKAGQKIADSGSYVSSPVHSSISGKVKRLVKILDPATSTLTEAVNIESDGNDEWVRLDKRFDMETSDDHRSLKKVIDSFSKEEILKKIREAGIVGMGGAAFPTHVKLNPPPQKKIDSLILNGCECEPFITSDHRVLLEYGRQVLAGLYIISRTLKPRDIYIAIEDNKKDAIDHTEELIRKMGFEGLVKIVSLPSRYPMGAEKTLVKAVLSRSIPIGGLPMDVGVVVNNVSTARAVYEGVIEGKPLVEKVVTVTGKFSGPRNLLVRIGTPVRFLIDECGIIENSFNKIIIGGPMMGNLIVDMDFPVVKALNCVLVKEDKAGLEQHCINCGRCISVCPMGLMPLVYARNVRNNHIETCREYYIENCIECGSCAYVCPANIPIVGYIKTGKSLLAEAKSKDG